MTPEYIDHWVDIATVTFAFALPLILWMLWQNLNRHHFTPRFDRELVDDRWTDIYVRDVCSHCGKTVERDQETSSGASQAADINRQPGASMPEGTTRPVGE